MDKTEQLLRNVLTYTTTHKEQLNSSAFDTESSSGVRREIENNKKKKELKKKIDKELK